MGNSLYDLHEVMIRWNVEGMSDEDIHSFHLCIGKETANSFREFLAELDSEEVNKWAREMAKLQIPEGVNVKIDLTECHFIGMLPFIRDDDIRDMYRVYIKKEGK